MRVLVDTHTFLWALLQDHRLTPGTKRILGSEEHELLFSLVSLWEIAIKMKKGKLNVLGSSVAYIRDEMSEYSMELLPLTYKHILQLEMLPPIHADPFDRLLIAQAIERKLLFSHGTRSFRSTAFKFSGSRTTTPAMPTFFATERLIPPTPFSCCF